MPGTVTTRRSSCLMWAILGLVLPADALDVIDATVTNIAAPTTERVASAGGPQAVSAERARPFHPLAGPFTTSRATYRDKCRFYSRVLVKGPGKW